MELPCRERGDELLRPGEMVNLRLRLRNLAPRDDLTTVIACAFDHRTRILPFIGCDLRIVPAGVRAIGSAMADVGFTKTRIVLQQWNKNFRPSQMRLDGRIPDLFMVSTMHLHSAECDRLIRDACQIDPAQRPLIVAGGPRVIYEPWKVFSDDIENPWGADVAVTGEEYVLLSLLEVLLSMRASRESLRSTFLRARDGGALDEIPGLVYSRSETADGPIEELVDTGIQRLLGDLDELPHPVLGYQLLEPPSAESTLGSRALPENRVRKHCLASSIVLTVGCRFRCSYCPIPAYNQRQYRVKSGERVADEMQQIANTYRIINFFGTDDNFFNDPSRALDIAETLARRASTGKRPHCKIRWATEATIHDTIRMQEHLPIIRQSGLKALWLGVEDITGSLVSKGQNGDKTLEALRLLRENGIQPVPMMMHHDSQPLVTWKSNYGLLNQLRILRKAGALYTQVLMLTPSPGSKWYEDTYTSGLAIQKVNGVPIEPHIVDGNYVVASKLPRPWTKQLNLLAGYTYFFNPIRLLIALVRSKSAIPFADAETRPPEEVRRYSRWKKARRWAYLKARARLIDAGVQAFGMYGLFHTYRRTLGWAWHLLRGNIQRYSETPVSRIPMRDPEGGPASHALPGTPVSEQVPNSPEVLALPARRKAA
ncbi:MAG: radical SAM protein [Planctomycetota bacterium]